jgi:hypothetical protein
MALIIRHPDVEDYIVEMSLTDIVSRGGVADLVETGHIVILKDFRFQFDFGALQQLSRSLDDIADPQLRRHVKKLEAPQFFDHAPSWRKPAFRDPLRQTLLDTLCRGDRKLFKRTAAALRYAHDEALRIFAAAFPSYEAYRLVPSVRITRTLFENLHWDDHSIDDDFHQARVFANLDERPRIWHVSHRVPTIMRKLYEEHDLGRFAGRDPNELLNYINGEVLGGMHKTWMDTQPRHRIAFDPGEVWLGESRLISHQIYYGEAALVYMWFVRAASMADPANRFNAVVEEVHRSMSEQGNAAAAE